MSDDRKAEQVPEEARAFWSHSKEMLLKALPNNGFPSCLSVMEKMIIANAPLPDY